MTARPMAIATLAATLALAAPVCAEERSATMRVSLVIRPSCSVSASPMTFDASEGSGADAESRIAVACNGEVPFAVALDGGHNEAGSQRRLAGVSGFVPYTIFMDPARQRPWDRETAVPAVTSNGLHHLTAYGRVDGEATVGAGGSYTDTVTVTVAF
ncbi:Spore Coat Protein U domain protein [Tsuneonella dongtanensis]|uniref:Spore Coat Protein U domain protein n=1 Tax=Tsuneonella dongtanensis TaxID=692370 RepID=A0A1B2AG87_9SPHN|nr:spore coat U domain-containing protein [Tsuneonella dongtanensis]ANY21160.1 Spore Coat Protein U domain protein [Tsuneonella dongtanensis]